MKSRPGRILAGIALAAVLIADYAFVPMPLVPAETAETLPPIYAEVKKLPADAVLIELPLPAWDGEEYEDALPTYRSIFHGRRIVNGYSGYAPPAYRIVREAMERFPERRTFDLLENLEVGYLLVHTAEYRAGKGAGDGRTIEGGNPPGHPDRRSIRRFPLSARTVSQGPRGRSSRSAPLRLGSSGTVRCGKPRLV